MGASLVRPRGHPPCHRSWGPASELQFTVFGVFSLPPSKDEARINPNRSNSYIQNPRNPRTPRSRLCHISIMYTRTTYIHTYPYMHAHTQTKQLSTTQDCVFADEVQLCEASFHFRLEIAIRACSLDHLPAPSI